MESIKASVLAKLLVEHIAKHGDGEVIIFDDYIKQYKTFNRSHISMNMNKQFTFDCQSELESFN